MADIEKQNSLIPLSQAVETIKTAILQGQYEANKGVNRIQLAVYFAIGKYLSNNTRRLPYGAGAIKAISDQLLREMPGLRGFSETSMKKMRLFYEAWQMLDAESAVATDDSQSTIAIGESSKDSSVATDKCDEQELSVATDKLQSADNKIDIYHSICVPNAVEFPIEDFFMMPFTHHTRLMAMCKDIEARYYYIHRTTQEHFQGYKSPMGVATYTTSADMPEELRKALPDMEELKRVLNQGTEQD